jgi:hypothetical protein
VADSLEEVIHEYLNANVSGDYNGIYWVEADDTTYDYLVFWQVDDAGTKTYLGVDDQGEARVQFDIWCEPTHNGRVRGVRKRTALRQSLESMKETRSGYSVYVTGISETTVQRSAASEPYHFVVDAVVNWRA